jgi:acetyl esterase
MQQLVDQLPIPASEVLDVGAWREAAGTLGKMIVGPHGPVSVASIEDRTLAGPEGAITARIYRPHGPAQGTIHHLHGGGWVVGNIDIIDSYARRLARDLSMVVVTSNYRLAPEYPFPSGFNDCLTAATWVLDHVGELGGADFPVILSGESAGGNLAAAVALSLRDVRPESTFDLQLLINPAVDLRETTVNRASFQADADPMLQTRNMLQLYPMYSAGHDRADPRLSPLAADTVAGLPAAVIAVLTIDPLHDEGVAYAVRLRDSGVPVELIEFDDLAHGFSGLTELVPAAARAVAETLERVKQMLAQHNSQNRAIATPIPADLS